MAFLTPRKRDVSGTPVGTNAGQATIAKAAAAQTANGARKVIPAAILLTPTASPISRTAFLTPARHNATDDMPGQDSAHVARNSWSPTHAHVTPPAQRANPDENTRN
eukprot:5805732-Amphidinium_carterae.1